MFLILFTYLNVNIIMSSKLISSFQSDLVCTEFFLEPYKNIFKIGYQTH